MDFETGSYPGRQDGFLIVKRGVETVEKSLPHSHLTLENDEEEQDHLQERLEGKQGSVSQTCRRSSPRYWRDTKSCLQEAVLEIDALLN